jgi:hypothetical protein
MRDCELWCDFDSQYVDAQRGIVRDRSGHGRHPVASGGPTFGQNGPDSFEAVSLDTTDDFFSVPQTVGEMKSEKTVFAVHDFSGSIIDSDEGTQGFSLRSNELVVRLSDGSIIQAELSKEPSSIVGRFDNGDILVTDGKDTTTNSTSTSIGTGQTDTTIGVNNNLRFGNSGGKLSVLAVWSRALSDAEIDYLNRLTAPRRSNV